MKFGTCHFNYRLTRMMKVLIPRTFIRLCRAMFVFVSYMQTSEFMGGWSWVFVDMSARDIGNATHQATYLVCLVDEFVF
ncbi:MAG: hypothetical protein NPIRA02_11450 [Nitrospirales bacterium]|nr:MAG: hypothetical protein NPIRA02_11450 [Nitrospirales bacterium]